GAAPARRRRRDRGAVHDPGRGCTGRDQAGAPAPRARARLLASVLPVASRLARHRRDPAHRRRRAARGDRRGAQPPARRADPHRRPATARQARQGRSAPRQSVADDRGRSRHRGGRVMRAVNLLPKDLVAERPSYKEALPVVGAAFVPLLTVLLVFVGYTNAHSDAATQLGRVAALQLELARTKPATAVKTVDTSELTSSRTARRAALQVALSRQMAWDRTLGDVARVLPSSVWLTDLTAVSPTPADST